MCARAFVAARRPLLHGDDATRARTSSRLARSQVSVYLCYAGGRLCAASRPRCSWVLRYSFALVQPSRCMILTHAIISYLRCSFTYKLYLRASATYTCQQRVLNSFALM